MNKRGITLTSLIITIIIMLILLSVGGTLSIQLIRKGNEQSLVTDMLLIQTKVKIIMERAAFSGDNSIYVGEKLKDNTNKKAIVGSSLTAEELEKDSIYIYNKATLESIGLGKIEINDEVFLVDYNNSDVIFPNGYKREDGSTFYRLSEIYNNLQTNAESFIQVVSFVTGEGFIDAQIYISDVKNEVVAYQFKIGTTEEEARNYEGTWQEETTYSFDGLDTGEDYYIIAKIKDINGNEKESQVYKVTTEAVKVANSPVVPKGANVQYVIWTTTDNVTWSENLSDTKPRGWYNYNQKQWANIKTTSTTANSDGTYNEAYWVWIPRYAYKVPARPTAESDLEADVPTFEIAFLKGTTNKPMDSTITGDATILPNTTESVSEGDWVVHPAFKFGDTQLEGIWVAKFEACSNAPNTVADGGGNTTSYQVNVKPSVPSWRSITATNMFDVCRNMTASTGALEGASSSDPHMMKNVEWGAVVYLAQSKYGKNGKVWNNPYYETIDTAWDDASITVSDNRVVLTGKASNVADNVEASSTTECDSYNTGNGPEASTTGNVYGVYDMAGGSYEYMAAYVNNSTAQSSSYITSLRTASENAVTVKYVDLYTASSGDTAQANYEANVSKYGDAVYETSYQGTEYMSWQRDFSAFPYSNLPTFCRGGSYRHMRYTGIFGFTCRDAGAGTYEQSFRPVCLAF